MGLLMSGRVDASASLRCSAKPTRRYNWEDEESQ
jgi:hypothetical protein